MFNFDEIQLIFFSFVAWAFGGLAKKLAKPSVTKLSPVFPSKVAPSLFAALCSSESCFTLLVASQLLPVNNSLYYILLFRLLVWCGFCFLPGT